MADSPLIRVLVALAVGWGLTAATLIGGWGAVACGVMAQVAFGLMMSWMLRSRCLVSWSALLRAQLPSIALLWVFATSLTVLLVAWPLEALRHNAGLEAVVGLSLAISLLVLLLWRHWLIIQAIERGDVQLREQWHCLAARGFDSWQGVVAAGLLLLLCALVIVPAWPELPKYGLQALLALATALLSPVLHGLLQKLPGLQESGIAALRISDLPPLAASSEPDQSALHGYSARLYSAARNGQVEQALHWLDEGADIHALPLPQAQDQRSLLVLATVLPDLRLLRALIERGADPNQHHGGMTALLAATRDSWYGRPEAVMTLLAHGADPSSADTDGNTPLHHATHSAGASIATLLCDADAPLNVLNRDGYSPLALACQRSNWPLVQFLLERQALPECEGGIPALVAVASAENDDPAGLQLLLQHHARADAGDANQRTALHVAAANGHVHMVKELVAAGASPDLADNYGRTPWLEAAAHAHFEVLQYLHAKAPDISIHTLDHQGNNAILLACQAENVTVSLVQWLLDLGIDPALPAADGRKAVEYAASAGHWSVVVLLDPAWPLPAAVLDTDLVANQAAPMQRPPLLLLREALLAEHFEDTDALARLCSPSELGSLLHVPEVAQHLPLLEWLIEHGADTREPDAQGQSLLSVLLDRGAQAMDSLQLLLRHHVDCSEPGGLARFLSACLHQSQDGADKEQLALQLLESGADRLSASKTDEPVLHLAIRLRWHRLQDQLLARGVDCQSSDTQGLSALHLAAALGCEATVKRLLRHGAALDVHSSDGQTPLGVALTHGHYSLTYWLQWNGWPLPGRALEPGDVMAAAIAGDAQAVQRLLELGLPVDAADAQGCTALLRAASGGQGAAVERLLAFGANPQHRNHKGVTPLAAAISAKRGRIVTALLGAGADPELRLPDGGLTALMLAAAYGLPDIAGQLLASGANVHSADEQQRTALHCAALHGFSTNDGPRLLALFDILLNAGADPNKAAAGGLTPLLLLLGGQLKSTGTCHEAVVLAALDRLLAGKAKVHVTCERHGLGPLHLAALNGLPKVVQRLLRAGADPNACDAQGRRPRQIALLRGFVDVAAVFGPTSYSSN